MNPRSAIVAALAVTSLVLAGCGENAPACGECDLPRATATRDAVWVAFGATLYRLDPATGRVVATARTTPGSVLSTVAATAAATWTATTGRLYVMPRGADRLRRVALDGVLPNVAPQSNTAVSAVGGGAVLTYGRTVLRLSPTAAPTVLYRTRSPQAWVTAEGRLLWVGERNGTLRRVDAVTGRVVGDPLWAGVPVADIAVTSSGPWVLGRHRHWGRPPPTDDLRGEPLQRVSPATGRVDRVTAGRYWTVVSDGAAGLWAQRARDGAVVRLDPATGAEVRATTEPGPECFALTHAAGSLYLGCTHGWVGVMRLDPPTLRTVWRTALPVG